MAVLVVGVKDGGLTRVSGGGERHDEMFLGLDCLLTLVMDVTILDGYHEANKFVSLRRS